MEERWGWLWVALINKCNMEWLRNNRRQLKVQFSSHFLDCRHYVQHLQWRKMREITETRKTWHYPVFAEGLCALCSYYIVIILNELYKSIMSFLNFLMSLSICVLIFFFGVFVCFLVCFFPTSDTWDLQLINRFNTFKNVCVRFPLLGEFLHKTVYMKEIIKTTITWIHRLFAFAYIIVGELSKY